MSLKVRIRLSYESIELDVDFAVPGQGVTALFGPSGAGKSTILRAISGLERPPDAHIEFQDEIWNDSAKRRYVPPHRRSVGYVVQGAGLFTHLNVQGNLQYACKRARNERLPLEQVVELLGIESFLDRRVHTLSGGERQRVAIARSLLTSPKLLLLDEPLSALDAKSKAQIMPYLERLHNELSIPMIYVSHALDEVTRIADRMLLLDRGHITAQGPIQELLTELAVPQLRGKEAAALILARVASYDAGYDLLELEFSGGWLFIQSHEGVELGAEIRISIRAADVSLALQEPFGTSILNVLPAEVLDVREDDDSPSQVLVKLKAGDDVIISRITRKSASALDLAVGQSLYAQVKSVALVG